MRKIFGKIWAIWFLVVFVLFFLLLYPLFFIGFSNKKFYPLVHFLRKLWGELIFLFGGFWPQVEFEEKLDEQKVYIFVPNHFSYLDIPMTSVGLNHYLNYMAKIELAKIPLFGKFFTTIDIAVNRKNPIMAVKAMERVKEQLLANKQSIVIFPEGTVSKTAPQLSKFKEGPFKLAIETQVAIVPVSLIDNWKRLPDDGSLTAFPGRLRMYVHRAIDTSGLKPDDQQMLLQKVYSIIENKLKEYEGK